MKPTRFGAAIRSARLKEGLKQGELCERVTAALANAGKANGKEVKLLQGTLSAWELGAQLPDPESAKAQRIVRELESQLKRGADDFWTLLREDKESPVADEHSLSETQYVDDARSIIKRADYKIDLWFFGPRSDLPVLHSDQVRRMWISNLSKGVGYNIVWFLDMIDETSLSSMLEFLASADSQLAKAGNTPGKVRHFVFKSNHAPRRSEFFLSCAARLMSGRNTLSEFMGIESVPLNTHIDIFLCGLGTIVLYQPRPGSELVEAKASLAINSFSRTPDGNEFDLFGWLARRWPHRLVSLADGIERFFRNSTPDKEHSQ